MHSKPTVLLFFMIFGMISGCSDSNNDASPVGAVSINPFPDLPVEGDSPVTVSGMVTFWFYEGDAGCYGTLSDGVKKIELWTDADTCDTHNGGYEDGDTASIDIIYSSENQYSSDGNKMYTIVRFN